MRKFVKLDKLKSQIKKQYESGLLARELAELHGVGERTMYDFLAQMRRKGEIGQNSYKTKSTVLNNPRYNRVTDASVASEQELLKLLSLYKTRAKVAKSMGVSTSTISNLCKEYGIIDTEHISKQINGALKEMLTGLEPYALVKKSKNKSGDTLVIQITDVHGGKVIKNQAGEEIFNAVICQERMAKLMAQILKLLDHNITKGVTITDVVILSTGDLANGENIYATQAYEQEIAPPKQFMLLVEILMKLILALVKRKLKVQFYGIKGNHGRTGKDTDPSANWDIMIYMVLDQWVRTTGLHKQVAVRYAETDYMVIDIRGHGYLLRHKAPEQSDSPSGRVKFNEWSRQHNVDAVVFGHFHHFGLNDCDGVRVFRGGSVPGGDDLSESMAKDSDPIQLVWGVNEKRIMTFFYAVDLASE